ncbi:hypothetical protein CHARACLAT_017095 [Characodon lateralis]|uniref:Uncharacterized protein n=1 Tax=Characodon lateralis TaxID=208331 RepID=A0ABU7E167_9TELE|nr:hypothetical protein [Characodon lateralis]
MLKGNTACTTRGHTPPQDAEPPTVQTMPISTQGQPPPSPQKKTYTHPNIRTSPRTHKTLDTQVGSAPPPPTEPPPHQQKALLEGESTCNEMVATHQFRRPLCPPMHRRSPGQCRVPQHELAQNPGNITARTQAPLALPGPQPGDDTPQEPRAPRPTPDPRRTSKTTRPAPSLAPCWRSLKNTLDHSLDSGSFSSWQPTLEIHLSGEANPVHPPTVPPGSPEKPQRIQQGLTVPRLATLSPWWIAPPEYQMACLVPMLHVHS